MTLVSRAQSKKKLEISPWTKEFRSCTSGFMLARSQIRLHLSQIWLILCRNVEKKCGEILCIDGKWSHGDSDWWILIFWEWRDQHVRIKWCESDGFSIYVLLRVESMNHLSCYLVVNYGLQPMCHCKFYKLDFAYLMGQGLCLQWLINDGETSAHLEINWAYRPLWSTVVIDWKVSKDWEQFLLLLRVPSCGTADVSNCNLFLSFCLSSELYFWSFIVSLYSWSYTLAISSVNPYVDVATSFQWKLV